MKLYYSGHSPFARKVRVTAIEKGLDGQIELIPADVRTPDADFLRINPLGKVPALVRDDGDNGGGVLIDSPLICEYLDSLSGDPRLFPPDGEARWKALKLHALADGIFDAGILYQMERMRADGKRSQRQLDRQADKFARGLDSIENDISVTEGPLNIGQIALACGFGYVDLRIGREFWAEGRPILAAWVDAFSQRPSMQATEPPPGA